MIENARKCSNVFLSCVRERAVCLKTIIINLYYSEKFCSRLFQTIDEQSEYWSGYA
jgi:hypothetical protein